MASLYQGQLLSWQYHSVVCRYNNICVYMHIRCALSLCQWGKEPLFNRYISRHTNISLTETCLTNQAQIGLCPHKVDLPAINLAAHDIYDQLIQSIQYNHTLWPCSCPCPTNKHVPHSQLINRISHLTWLILSISPVVTWYEYKVTD